MEITYSSDMGLGKGFNKFTNIVRGDVIKTPSNIQTTTFQTVTGQTRIVNNYQELLDFTSISASASLSDVIYGSISAKVDFMKQFSFSEYSLYILIHVKVMNSATTLMNPELSSYAYDLQRTPEAFYKQYGTHFINGFIEGGEFIGIFETLTRTEEEQRNIKVMVEAEGTWGTTSASISVEFVNLVKKLSQRRSTLAQFFQIGGLGNTSSYVNTPEKMLDRAANFSEIVRTNPAKYEAILMDYEAIPHDLQSNFIALQQKQDVINKISRERNDRFIAINSIEYVLRNEELFQSFDPNELNNERNKLGSEISILLDKAKDCFESVDNCLYPTEQVSALNVNLPKRKEQDANNTDLPTPVGSPIKYQKPICPNVMMGPISHRFFCNLDARIHTFWFDGIWNHQDITNIASLPDVKSSLILTPSDAFNVGNSFLVQSRDKKLYQVAKTGSVLNWSYREIIFNSVPTPKYLPMFFTNMFGSYLIYVGEDNNIHKVLFTPTINISTHENLTIKIGLPEAQGNLLSEETFVGKDNNLYKFNAGDYSVINLTDLYSQNLPAGSIVGSLGGILGKRKVLTAHRSFSGSIFVLLGIPTALGNPGNLNRKLFDLMSFNDFPLSASDPVCLVKANGHNYIFYTSIYGHIICLEGILGIDPSQDTWSARDITQITFAPKSASPPELDKENYIYFIDSKGKLHLLIEQNEIWIHKNISL